MDIQKVEELLDALQDIEIAWRGSGRRARALEQLRHLTGQDLGDDSASWLSWWGAVGRLVTPPTTTNADPSGGAALSALREMGLVDEAEFAVWNGTFSHIARGLVFYLGSCDGPSLRVAHAGAHCWTEPQRETLEGQLRAFIARGGYAAGVVELSRREGKEVVCRLDEVQVPLGDYPARGIFRALHCWSGRRTSPRQLWLDAANRLWWLSEANVEAIRRYGVLRLRRTHPREPGAPHAEVDVAWRRLELLGLRSRRARARLGWEMDLFDERRHARRHSYETQILDLEGAGVLVADIDLGFSLDAASLTERLSRVAGVVLCAEAQDEFFDLRQLLAHLNEQLHAVSPGGQLVALRSRQHWVRIVCLPREVVGAFAELVEVVAGDEIVCPANSQPAPCPLLSPHV